MCNVFIQTQRILQSPVLRNPPKAEKRGIRYTFDPLGRAGSPELVLLRPSPGAWEKRNSRKARPISAFACAYLDQKPFGPF